MQWQDLILGGGAFLFAVALIPTIRHKEKPPLSTSLMTGIILVIFAITYATMNLWLATLSNVLSAAAWLTIAAQSLLKKDF